MFVISIESYLGTNLVTALSGLNVYNFPHCAAGCKDADAACVTAADAALPLYHWSLISSLAGSQSRGAGLMQWTCCSIACPSVTPTQRKCWLCVYVKTPQNAHTWHKMLINLIYKLVVILVLFLFHIQKEYLFIYSQFFPAEGSETLCDGSEAFTKDSDTQLEK